MQSMRRFSAHVTRESLRAAQEWRNAPRATKAAGAAAQTTEKSKPNVDEVDDEDTTFYPRKIFSGIQPTGALHLGNYLGAVQKWTELQNAREDVTYCIVDMHSITLPQEPQKLRSNILQMAATMLACGIDPEQSTLFVQSAVQEHSELCWILSCHSTMARLGHLPQYKEKTRKIKDIPLGLFVYPVLQAADIMLYKSTHVPVGEDQLQHIQLTQHLAKTFNTKYGPTFPICHAVIDNKQAARIRSLRDPSKKMSKSDTDERATINLTDTPELIVEKVKKAITDFTSDVSYEPDTRPGVSNLIAIHSLVSGQSIESICNEAKRIDTGMYKLRVADAVVEHLRPIREKIAEHLEHREELSYVLECGAERARQTAQQTMEEVMHKLGMGAGLLQPSFADRKLPSLQVYESKALPNKVPFKKISKPSKPEPKVVHKTTLLTMASELPKAESSKSDASKSESSKSESSKSASSRSNSSKSETSDLESPTGFVPIITAAETAKAGAAQTSDKTAADTEKSSSKSAQTHPLPEELKI